MRTDHDAKAGNRRQRLEGLLGNAQFGRGAAPEQVARGSGDDQPVWCERSKLGDEIFIRPIVQLGVNHQHVVTLALEERADPAPHEMVIISQNDPHN